VAQPPLLPALTQNYTDVAYVEHLARSAMELHHKRTGRGMQHDLQLERVANDQKMKRLEEEQIKMAARGVFAFSKGKEAAARAGTKREEEEESSTNGKRKGGGGRSLRRW